MGIKKVAIIMGSNKDLPVAKRAAEVLKKFGIQYEIRVLSAFRTPAVTVKYSELAVENGIGVIIAIAGKAAHLAGIIAAHTPLPVIGLPMKSGTLDGLDALISAVDMPKGIPVASVNIDGAENAALFAIQILSVENNELRKKIVEMKKEMEEQVIAQDLQIDLEHEIGMV